MTHNAPLRFAAKHGLRYRRMVLIAGAMLLLLIGMWGGLLRLGWPWPGVLLRAVTFHGPLMVGGFLGTLLAIERAVALQRGWAYVAPAASLAGCAALLAGLPFGYGAALLVLASAVLVVDFLVIVRIQPALFTVTMGLGAAAWLAGNILWMSSGAVPPAVPWWIAFLVLTIVGERLELSRFLPDSRRKRAGFIVAVTIYMLGLVLGLGWLGLGWAVSGAGLIALAAWLIVYDIARRTVRQTGLTRFIAVCLLSGYFWLIVTGAIAVAELALLPIAQGGAWLSLGPLARGSLVYDALLHALFLGFVFAMIFGHAPIIFPAVLNVRIPYRPRFYSHLALLELSVALRIAADLAGWWTVREWAGLFNVVAILLFLVNTVVSISRSRLSKAAVLRC